MISILRGLRMLDSVPWGDLAVFGFLEMVALGFVLEAVAAFERGDHWWKWLGSVVLGLMFFLAGIMWPRFKPRLRGAVLGFRNQDAGTPYEVAPVLSTSETVIDEMTL